MSSATHPASATTSPRRRSAVRPRQADRRFRRRHQRRPLVEPLEDRMMLTMAGLFDPIMPLVENGSNGSPGAPDSSVSGASFVPGEILIGFEHHLACVYRSRGSTAALELSEALLEPFGLRSPKMLVTTAETHDPSIPVATRWQVSPDAGVLETIQRLAGNAGIAYAEPNYQLSAGALPNDPQLDNLWGLHNIGQSGGTVDADIDAPEAWELTVGSTGTVVGVIDSGVDYTHPDLLPNIWINQQEIPTNLRSQLADVDADGAITFRDLNHDFNAGHVRDLNGNRLIDPFDLLNDARWVTGTDTDGNGYVDDLFGWDFYNNDNDPFDDHGHGTHCAGTIGAAGNNGQGVAGVNWNVLIMGLKFLGPGGSGPTSAAAAAVSYATALANRGENIRLTSNSWGGGGFSQTLYDAISVSGAANMLFVAAAGNASSDIDATPFYPASYDLPNIISVASTDRNDALSSFSNFGVTSVDLAAPGSSIVSTTVGGKYGSMSGTSMAAPHVSGVAALAWSYAPQASYPQIRDAMFQGVDSILALQGTSVTGGRLNARNTLDQFPSDPGDTLATAHVTRLASPVVGDYHIVSVAEIGDGVFGAKDVDLYQVKGIPGSSLAVITSQPAGANPMSTVLRLFDSAGNPLAVDNSAGYSRLDYTFPDAGTYFVGVSGDGNPTYNPSIGGSGSVGDTGTYQLELGFDAGDTIATAAATEIANLGDRFQHPSMRLGDGASLAGDVDMYAFTARADSRLTAVTSQPWGEDATQTVLRLFDTNGIELAIAHPSGYARLDYTFGEAGTYYIGVSGSGNVDYDPATGGSGNVGATGHYRLDLTVDVALDRATYIGGTGNDYIYASAVAHDGSEFVAGFTNSLDLPKPVSGSTYLGGSMDAFVAKIDPQGDVIWTAYLGGTGSDYARGIAIDSFGNLVVTGYTNSEDLPNTTNGYKGGTWDSFVAKIDGTTGSVGWTTYLGGSGSDYARGIAIDSSGVLFVTGYTNSEDLPNRTNGYQGGSMDAFVIKIDPQGDVIWTTYLGGSGSDYAALYAAIAIDSTDNVFVTGYTDSQELAHQINGFQGGTRDGFVAKIDGAGTVAWTMYLGGTGDDFARGIAIDATDNVLFAGYTYSNDLPNATNGSRGGADGFVAKIGGGGTVEWTTYLGGSGSDYAYAIAASSTDAVFVTGSSSSADFQWATNTAAGNSDATLIRLDGSTGTVAWMMYLGGSGNDYGCAIATDGQDRVYVTGYTSSANLTGALNTQQGGLDGFLVKIDPTLVPSPPTSPTNDAYTAMSGATLAVDAAAGVLANDVPPAGVARGQLSVELISGPIHGQLQLAGDGSFLYMPPHNFLGSDSFWYRVFDGDRYSNAACVTVDVQGVTHHSTDTPKPIRDGGVSSSRRTDSTLTISGTDMTVGALLLDLSIAHSAPSDLSADLVSPTGTRVQLFNQVTTIPTTLDLSATFFGESLAGEWKLEIWDHMKWYTGTLNAWSLTVAPLVENSPPAALDDHYSVAWNTLLTVPAPGVLANDLDPDGDVTTAVLQSGPSNGTLELNANGSFTYTPSQDYHGTDSFTYRAFDESTSSQSATVTITVKAPNLPPTAIGDIYSVGRNQTLDVAAPGVLANDSDPNGDSLTAMLVEGPTHGELWFNSDGSFTYTPVEGFVGIDAFTYEVSDGELSCSATVAIDVANHAPVAEDDSYSTFQGEALAVAPPGVLVNDSDPDGDPISALPLSGTTAGGGQIALAADGSFTYTPLANFNGIDTFFYTVTDGHSYSNTATVTITVPRPNHAPVANDDDYGTSEDTLLAVAAPGLLSNDSDADGDPLTAILVSGPIHGTLTLNADGSFTYDPDQNFNGTDSFTYQATDTLAQSNVATVLLTVDPVNDPPLAGDDVATTRRDLAVVIEVLANDSDPDGDFLSVTGASTPGNGTAVVNQDHTITYTPNAGFSGTDSFIYTISDGNGGTAQATVSLEVSAANANALYVYNIRFESKRSNKDWRAVFEIRSDSNADGLGGVTDSVAAGVTITVEFAGRFYTGTTDSEGIFRTSWINNLSSGDHTAEVVDLVMANYYWDMLLDLENDSDGDGLPDNVLSI